MKNIFQSQRFMNQKKSGMMKVLVLVLSVLVTSMGSQVYSTNLHCGTCQSKSGCLGNICMIFSGDINDEYCYGQSTCDGFGIQTSVSLGECTVDSKGSLCSSGLCMSGANINTCYGNTTDFCFDGVTQQIYCSNKVIRSIMYGGMYGLRQNGFWVQLTIPEDCPFSSGIGIFQRCSNDVFGNYCSCCQISSYQGMISASGSCVPSESPIAQVKSSISGKYGFQQLLSFLLLGLLALTLII